MTSLGRLTRSGVTLITVTVATIIFFAGIAYAIVRPVTYQSQATLVLVPNPPEGSDSDLPGILDSFQRSGTAVTYVELLASSDLLKQAGDPPVTVTVRSVPDSRIIRISASATDENIVQPALRSIVTAADREQEKLIDIWDLRTLQAPNEPTKASTGTGVILIATLLLSLLGAVATWTLLRRYGSGGPPESRGGRERPGDGARAEALAAAGWLTREGPRYPTSR